MSIKRTEIESAVDIVLEEMLTEIFDSFSFKTIDEIEHALEYLQEKINEIEPSDYEEYLT